MAINEKKYRELYSLRQRIKDSEKRREGRAPLVCTDDSLYEIAQLCPKKLSDFYGVLAAFFKKSILAELLVQYFGNDFFFERVYHFSCKSEPAG